MTYSKLLNIPLTTSSNRVAIAASKALHQVKNLDWEFKAELKWGATDNWQLDANNNFALHVRTDGYYLFSRYGSTDIIDQVVQLLELEGAIS